MKRFIFLGLFIFLWGSVLAISGVNPGSYEVDFEPDYQIELSFDFVLDGGVSEDLIVEGELAEYVSLNKKRISGRENVIASLDLPSEIDSPGVNYIRIIAGDVVGAIKVRVPYPEKYIELSLSAPNVNVGEEMGMVLEIINQGNESISFEGRIEIYNGDELVESLEISGGNIVFEDSRGVNISLDTENYFPGDYLAVALIDYGGKVARIENPFRLGEQLVGVLNYTREFGENKINRFEIEVESLWNDDMDDLFIEVNIIGFEDANFITPVVGLSAWRTITLFGFLDTNLISGYEFEAEIILHHGGKISTRVVQLKIIKGFDYIFWISILAMIIIVVLLIWRGKIFLERLRKLVVSRKK